MKMKSKRIDGALCIGMLLVIVYTVLVHGVVEAWSLAVFEIVVVLLLCLFVIKILLPNGVDLTFPSTFWPLLAFFVLGLIQSISSVAPDGHITSLSYDVEATRQTVQVLFFLLVAHLISANVFTSDDKLRLLANFLVTFGSIVAVFSLIQYFTWNGSIYWFRPSSSGGWVQGPFVNHNHLAGYLELLIPIPIAFVLTGVAKHLRLVYGFAAVLMALAAILAVSRGGIISLVVGFLFLGVAGQHYARRKKARTRTWHGASTEAAKAPWLRNAAVIGLISMAIFAGLVWMGLDPLMKRLPGTEAVQLGQNAESFESSRGWIWKNSLHIFTNNMVLGTGLGTFQTVFPIYSEGFQATAEGQPYVWDRAHNDYLQVLTDSGLVGGGLASWFIIAVLVSIRRGLLLSDELAAAISLGFGAGILSMMVHSIFDFNLQLPSTSLVFLVLVSGIVYVSRTNPRGAGELNHLSMVENSAADTP